ncbi:MAG: mandelate racemase/muconate lactonizing enzyme family protein [Microbacteriaceae bacterium]
MKIQQFNIFTCDLGWRTISFLKVVSEDGIAGWSEFTESFGNQGLVKVVESLKRHVIGRSAMHVGLISAELTANSGPAPSGLNRQATAVVENALYDLKARSLGISVADLLGGKQRDSLLVYWSHCGTYRQGHQAELIGQTKLSSYRELSDFAQTVKEQGFKYLKTNTIAFDDPEVGSRPFPWTRRPNSANREWDTRFIRAIRSTLEAFREGVGDEVGIIFDANIGFGIDGMKRIARSVEEFGLEWFELDGLSPQTLAHLRSATTTPIASGESLFGREEYLPYFQEQSMDLAIVDVLWNGVGETSRIASAAESYQLDLAPHNFYGHLSTFISAQLCAAIPNFNIFEIDIDGVPWRDELVSEAPRIVDGSLIVPEGSGWGVEVNEDAVKFYSVDERDRSKTVIQ